MADIQRVGTAVWRGDLRGGNGKVSTGSGVLADEAYRFATRFENEAGTNPEELIGAAHAGCYAMAFAGVLGDKGYEVEGLEATATVHLARQEGGFAITKSELEVRGRVSGIDRATFERLAEEADQGCPVSNLLRPGLEISVEAVLV